MNYSRMIIFFGIFLLILTLVDLYVLSNWKKFCKSKNLNKLFYKSLYYVSVLMLIAFIYSNYYNFFVFPIPDYIQYFNIITSFWYLPKLLILPVLLIIDIFKISKKVKLKFQKSETNISPKVKVKSRRDFIGNLAWSFAGIPFLMALDGLLYTIEALKIFKEKIILPNLPIELHGLKIVQLSDLHFGAYDNSDFLNKILQSIEKLSPDLIFITGDFVNFRYEELDNGEDFLRNLKANYGVYACLGNHDHYMPDEDHQKLIRRINGTGVKLLINESKVLEIKGKEINLVGVDNYGSRQTYGDFEKAYQNVNGKNITILLSHDPRTWESHILGKRRTDLTLSGHTHGGQVAVEFMGIDLSIAKAIYKHYKGLYSEGNQYLYVNSGIGVSGPPIRYGINPEITLLTLEKPNNLAKI